MPQWYLEISKYSEELGSDLEKLNGIWPSDIINKQRNWIGKSEGLIINLKVSNPLKKNFDLKVFTTRPETMLNIKFVSVSPLHPILDSLDLDDYIKTKLNKLKKNYMKQLMQKKELINLTKKSLQTQDLDEMTIIDSNCTFKNPFKTENDEGLPLLISNFVYYDYATGAMAGVPDLDEVDRIAYNLYLKQYNLRPHSNKIYQKNDDLFQYAIDNNIGYKSTQYRMRDWLISRQRYWGAPMPFIHCKNCKVVPVPYDQLPLKLPDYENIKKGKSLKHYEDWINVKCPKCGSDSKRDLNTMDTFVDSSWYYLRFLDSKNKSDLIDRNKMNPSILPINIYIGGNEHAILHLLYSRFIYRTLIDCDLLPKIQFRDPFYQILSQGMVKAPTYMDQNGRYYSSNEVKIKKDGYEVNDVENSIQVTKKFMKMSKSKNNGIKPKEIINQFGIDSLRLYILFKAPPRNDLNWDSSAISGMKNFLKKLEKLCQLTTITENNEIDLFKKDKIRLINLFEKVGKSYSEFKFNTIVSDLIIITNHITNNQNCNLGLGTKVCFDNVVSYRTKRIIKVL